MGGLLANCLLLTAVAQAPNSDPSPGQLVDRVVATVDTRVITLSELVAETGLVLLDTRGPRVALEGGLPRSVLRTVLRSMVDGAVILQEVQRLQLRPTDPDAARREVERLLSQFESEAERRRFLLEYGFDPDRSIPPLMLQRVEAQLGVDRFIDLRLRLQLDLSEDQLRLCYAENRDRFPGQSFEEAEPAIRAKLRAQLEERALQRLLERLEAEAEIRYAPEYRPLPRADGPELWSCPLP
jgi:hypothetical protein